MPKRLQNALIIIVLLVLVLGGAAVYLLDPIGVRTYSTEKLRSDFEIRAQQYYGDQGEVTVLIEYNDDVIALLCCNESQDEGWCEFHRRVLLSGRWEKSFSGAYLAPNAPSHTYTYEPPDSQYELSAYCSMGNENTEPVVHLP